MIGYQRWFVATVLILFGLLLVTVSSKKDEDDLTDPYAWDYDRTTKTNRRNSDKEWIKPGEEIDCSLDHVKMACANCGYGSGESPSANDLNLFRHVTRSIIEHYEMYPGKDSLVLTLSSYQRERLLKFVKGGDVPKVDIKDMLRTSWSVQTDPGSSLPVTILGFTQNEFVVGLLVLLLATSIFLMALTFRISFLRVMLALFFTSMVMSFLWSYMFLYQRAIAKRMADDAIRGQYNESCQSSEKATFFSRIGSFFRRADDPCAKYFHDHQVHIALEVLPVDAITHTFGAIMTSISGFFGVSLAEMSGGFLGSLSFAMWLPAFAILLVTLITVLAVCLYCGGRHHPIIIQDAVRVAPPGQRFAVEDGSRDDAWDGARYRNRGDNRLEEAHPPRYAITDSARDNAHSRNRDDYGITARQRNDDNTLRMEAQPRRNDTVDSSRDNVHNRGDRVAEMPPRYDSDWVNHDRRYLERDLEDHGERSRGYPVRRGDEANTRQRRPVQAHDVVDQEKGDDDYGEDKQGRYKQVSKRGWGNRDRGQNPASRDNIGDDLKRMQEAKTATRDKMRDGDLEQQRTPEDERDRGACVGDGEGRVQEVGREGQNGAGDQTELKDDDQPIKPLPDSTGAEDTHLQSSQVEITQNLYQRTHPTTAAEEHSSEDDFEVIPEE